MNSETILQKNGLSKTRNRVNILDALKTSRVPLSGKEICTGLSEKCDKSTVHRTLNSLFEKQVLQRVIIDHEVKYALKTEHNQKSGNNNDHLHFKCSKCNKLFCLTEIAVQDYNLPEGFIKVENQFLVIGICKQCQ
jgi:Fur family ferric uptake transcriptional regulator